MINLKKLFQYLLILSFCIFLGCSINASHSNKNDSSAYKKTVSLKPNSAFRVFLNKFKVLSLPLTIRTLKIVVDSSGKLNNKDNIFIKSQYPDEIYAYGILPDTTDNYKIIWLEPTEIEVPVLTTFTKDGKKIKEVELGVGGCGSDCGFECSEFIMISKDLTIFSVDSVKKTDCDTSGNLKDNTTKKYIRYKTGKIRNSGKIDMTDILKKPIS